MLTFSANKYTVDTIDLMEQNSGLWKVVWLVRLGHTSFFFAQAVEVPTAHVQANCKIIYSVKNGKTLGFHSATTWHLRHVKQDRYYGTGRGLLGFFL